MYCFPTLLIRLTCTYRKPVFWNNFFFLHLARSKINFKNSLWYKTQGLYITPFTTLFVQTGYQWLPIQQHTSINILLIILQPAEWLQRYCKVQLSTLTWTRIKTKYKGQNKVLPSHLLSLFSRNYLASYSPLTCCVLISSWN